MAGFENQKFINPQFKTVEILKFQANSLLNEITTPGFPAKNEKMDKDIGVIVNPLTYEIKIIPDTKTKPPKEQKEIPPKKKFSPESAYDDKSATTFSSNLIINNSKTENKKPKEKEKKKTEESKEEKKPEVAAKIPVATSTLEVKQEQVSKFKTKKQFKPGTFDFMLKYGMDPDKVHEIKNSKDSDIDLLEKYSVNEIAFAKVLKKDKEGNYFVNNAEIQNWAKMVDGKTIPKDYSIMGFSSFTPGTEKFLKDSGFNPTIIYAMLEAAEKGKTLVGEYPTSALFLVGLMKKKGDTYSIDKEGIKQFKTKDEEHWKALSGKKPLEDTQVVSSENNEINSVQDEEIEDSGEIEQVPHTTQPAEQVVKKEKKEENKESDVVKKYVQAKKEAGHQDIKKEERKRKGEEIKTEKPSTEKKKEVDKDVEAAMNTDI